MPEFSDSPDASDQSLPLQTLSIIDAMAITIGIVVGAGIFRTPSLVAANSGDAATFLLLWGLGGLVSLVGALCYAELSSAFPHPGGDYHFIDRAYGRPLAFLFAWSRIAVIQTGSIALLAFLFGDYASELLQLGEHSASFYAAAVVVGLTAINVIGLRIGIGLQRGILAAEIACLLIVIGAGLLFGGGGSAVASDSAVSTSGSGVGLAMVFVLLTYGGWNEAAYVSSEVRGSRRNVAWALLLSIGVVAALYLLINLAYLRVLGTVGMAASDAVAAELMTRTIGQHGAAAVTILILLSALTSANATVMTGARGGYALGCDVPLFRYLGRWHAASNSPVRAVVAQGGAALALVGAGALARDGFAAMVEYTAPVFWFFFLLTGVSLIILRIREPNVYRPFTVPLYPVLPILFCGVCLYMLQSSIAYTGTGAFVGLGVLAAGVPLYLIGRQRPESPILTITTSEETP